MIVYTTIPKGTRGDMKSIIPLTVIGIALILQSYTVHIQRQTIEKWKTNFYEMSKAFNSLNKAFEKQTKNAEEAQDMVRKLLYETP